MNNLELRVSSISAEVKSFFRRGRLFHECKFAMSLASLIQLLLRHRVRTLLLLLLFDQLLREVLVQNRISYVAQVVLVRSLIQVLLLSLDLV